MGLQQAGRIDEAAELYRAMLRANPSHFEAMYSLGLTQFQAGRTDEAQNLLGQGPRPK